MELISFSGSAYDLVESYLTKRQQCTIITHGHRRLYSQWGTIKQRVPQGSIVVPILFLICVNDLPEVHNGNISLSADVLVVLRAPTVGILCNELIETLESFQTWIKQNDYILTSTKLI